ncbi:MAG: YgeY family selenium metabolism-linked hydrolase [Lachnospiraceae bacterium]
MIGKEREEQLIRFCQKMIQAKSYSGEEDKVVKEMRKFCDETGFTDIHVDKYGNCICHIKGKQSGPKILFDGHMDTVPVPDPTGWEHDPFGAEIVDGKMYGRGTSDMKGALSSMLAAAIFFAKDCDYDFKGDIYVAGVVHEECFEGVAAREISAYVKPDYVIIGEASQLNIKIGQRGRGELQVETFGVPAHSASPHEGVNAVYKMCKVIEAIQKLVPPKHPVLGEGILELVDVKSSPFPGASVVPDYCRATYDRRLLVGETKQSVLEPIQELLDNMTKEDPELKAKVSFVTMEENCYTGSKIESERFFPGWLYQKEDPFVQAVYKEMKSMGFEPTITNYDFCTNGSHYAGEAGIKTLGIGPSKEILAHKINEYIEIDQLLKATQCYYGTMKALLK